MFFNAQASNGQLKKDSSVINDVRSLFKLDFSLNVVGPQLEQKISKSSSINFFAGASLGKAVDGFSFSNFNAKWIVSPNIYAEYRNYYNLLSRNDKKKKTINNSANFLFGRVEVYLPIKNQNFFNLLFIQGWGAQRSLGRKITIDCHVGVIEHVYYDKSPHGGFNYILIEPLIATSLNYIFNYSKKNEKK